MGRLWWDIANCTPVILLLSKKLYGCSECTQAFRSKATSLYTEEHTQVRTLTCVLHLRTHSAEKPYAYNTHENVYPKSLCLQKQFSGKKYLYVLNAEGLHLETLSKYQREPTWKS